MQVLVFRLSDYSSQSSGFILGPAWTGPFWFLPTVLLPSDGAQEQQAHTTHRLHHCTVRDGPQ